MRKRCFLSAFLVLLLLSCTDKKWEFNTDYLAVVVNNEGYITSMQNTTVEPYREFSQADKPSPLLSLYSSEQKRYYYPKRARYDQPTNTMRLDYTNGTVAQILLQPQAKYIRMELKSLEPRNGVDAIQWGSYYTNITNILGEIIGVARDTTEAVNYSIGVLSLDDNTIGGTSDIEGDAAPFQYIIHTPDAKRFPLPDNLHEGQVFTLGGDGVSDVAFYANKEPYYRIMYGNAAMVDEKGCIYINYHSRNRTIERQVCYSLIPNMPANTPNHIDVEPVPGVDVIGSSVALWGSPDSTALMDVIQTIVRSEHLPYPTVNGKWVKDPAAYVPDLMTYGGQYDSILSYASQLGFKSIYAYDQGFLRPNRRNEGYIDGKSFENKPFRFASGNLSHKEFGELAQSKGVLLGRVNISNSLAPGTLDASPIPSDSLCYQQRRKLMNNLSATDTLITIDNPQYMEEIASWEGHCKGLNMVKIGKELIHYLGVSTESPYRLLNVTRGYWGTQAANHKEGDIIEKLQVTLDYGYDGIIPNLALQDKIAGHYADICKLNNVAHYDFDGQEFLFNNGHGYYSTKRFFRKMFEHAEQLGVPYIRVSGATLSEGSWHYQSVWNVGGGKNLYDVDTRQWGSATSQGKDLRDVTWANYFPVSFGGNFPINAASTVEQYEHIQAIAIGFGATYYLKVGQNDVESCPQKEQIFAAIRTWERARSANAFPRSIKKMLMCPEYNWRLQENPDGNSWQLDRLENGLAVNTYLLKRAKGY